MDIVPDSQFCSVNLCVFIPIEKSLDDGSFVVCFEMGKCKSFNFVLLDQDCFGYSGSLAILCDF